MVDRLVQIANHPRTLVATTVANLVACGLAYAVLEHVGPVSGVWWAIVTGFTVGYGDFYPATVPGRGVGAWLIVSMFVLALCLGANITARLIRDEDEWSHEEQEDLKAGQARLREDQARVAEAVERLEAGQARLQETLAGLEAVIRTAAAVRTIDAVRPGDAAKPADAPSSGDVRWQSARGSTGGPADSAR